MKLLIVNGPNLNLLGIREPEIYGHQTYDHLITLIKTYCEDNNHVMTSFQSNHEGELLDFIHDNYKRYDALVLNAAAYTHTSIALYDCLKAITIPTVEVHISDVNGREAFRKVNYISGACLKTISNKGFEGYIEAIKFLEGYLS